MTENLPAARWRLLLASSVVLAMTGAIVGWEFIPGQSITHLDIFIDLRDDRKLAGIADNVFIGRVTKKLGRRTDRYGFRETHFRVEVLESLKGPLPATVRIIDNGSTTDENGGIWIFEDALVLPEPGKSYLFVTLHDEENDTHTVISGGYGRIEIAGSENLQAREVLTSKPAVELKARFTKAVEHQIL